MKIGEMKKLFFVSFAAVLMLSMAPVFAETKPVALGTQVRGPKVFISKMFLIGNGVAISKSDPSDFRIVSIGLAKVKVSVSGESKELNAGVIRLDDEKYRLRDVSVENGTFTSNIYSNETKVGSITADSVIKVNREAWYGTISINGKEYNLYILNIPRHFKRADIANGIGNYCKENPNDEKCKMVSTYSAKGSQKIAEYCENHPDDNRCKALEKAYCLRNMDDDRCRTLIENECSKNETSSICMALKKRQMIQYCKKNPLDKQCIQIEKENVVNYCTDHPDDKRCKNAQIVSRVRNAVREREYCIKNPADDKCVVFCNDHPMLCRVRSRIEQGNRTNEAENKETNGTENESNNEMPNKIVIPNKMNNMSDGE